MSKTGRSAKAKEYLSRAYLNNAQIDNKLNQLADLRAMVTKATSHLSDMPRTDSSNPKSMEDTIIKIVDLEREITADIDALVDLKREIISTIKAVEDITLQTLLEMRYLCFEKWVDIAEKLRIEERHAYLLHGKALSSVGEIIFS